MTISKDVSLSDYILENVMNTKSIINKYEHAQIISKRLQQLLTNDKSPLYSRNIDSNEAHQVAELELKRGVIPVDLYRRNPGNVCQKVEISQMKLVPTSRIICSVPDCEISSPRHKKPKLCC